MEDKFVLVACEESQRVCAEFRKLGFIAFSCDIKPESGGHPEWHIQGDVLDVLYPPLYFKTMDCMVHRVPKWDLIIAHPPCTRLCNSGQRWRFWGSDEQRKRKERETVDAIKFFMTFAMLTNCDHIAIENPVGIMSNIYRKPDCIYNPYDFAGETDCKKTCLWLRGLPPLKPTQSLPQEQRTQNIWKAHFNGKSYSWNSPETARLRSQTPVGVAKAMAAQWAEVLKGENDGEDNS